MVIDLSHLFTHHHNKRIQNLLYNLPYLAMQLTLLITHHALFKISFDTIQKLSPDTVMIGLTISKMTNTIFATSRYVMRYHSASEHAGIWIGSALLN